MVSQDLWALHRSGVHRLVENCKREESMLKMTSPFSKKSPIRAIEQSRKELAIKLDAQNELTSILKELEGYEPGILERMYAYKKLERDWEVKEAARTVKARDGL